MLWEGKTDWGHDITRNMQKSDEEVESDDLQLVGRNADEKHGPVEMGDIQTPNDQTGIIPVVVWECEEIDIGWDILLSDLVQWDGRWSTIHVCEDSVGEHGSLFNGREIHSTLWWEWRDLLNSAIESVGLHNGWIIWDERDDPKCVIFDTRDHEWQPIHQYDEREERENPTKWRIWWTPNETSKNEWNL